MKQHAVRIGNLPLILVLLSNGQIVIYPQESFNTIIDQSDIGITSIIDVESMLVSGTEIEYNELLSYKEMPELLSWLQQQNLISPIS